MFPSEDVGCDVLELVERCAGIVGAAEGYMHSAFGEFCERVDSGLYVFEFFPECEFRIRGQGCGGKCRYEDGFRCPGRPGQCAVWPLDDCRPQSALEEESLYLFRVERGDFHCPEIFILLLLVGLYPDFEQFPFLSADYFGYGPADWRSEKDFRRYLVGEYRGACKHCVSFSSKKPRQEASELGRFDSHNVRNYHLLRFQGCGPGYRDVQPSFQFDDVRHYINRFCVFSQNRREYT